MMKKLCLICLLCWAPRAWAGIISSYSTAIPILNQSTLQSGATFYVSSGTATNLNTTTLKFNDGTTQITAAAGGGSSTIIAVGTGTASNFTTVITSPTNNVSFLGNQFGSLTSGTTNFISINTSGSGLFPWLAPNGTVGAPSYSFSANTNQGMYSVDSNHLDFSVGGSKAGAFDFNIGEFVLGSNYAFALAGTSSAAQIYQIGDRATGIAFPGTNNMTLRGGGSTAVNITANQVAVQSGFRLFLPVGTAANPTLTFTTNSGGLYSPGANIIGFSNSSIETARIDANGNLGVGAVPSTKLHLSSGTFTIDGNVSPAVTIKGTGAPTDSQALCLLNGQLGHCTAVVVVSGACTCVVP
jgi:hypothetical protein